MPSHKFTLVFILCCLSLSTFSQSGFDLLIKAIETDQLTAVPEEQKIRINNLESINTSHLDYSPVIHNDGIVFSSNRPRKKNFISKFFTTLNSNLYYTAAESDGFYFTPIELPGKVNTSKHEGSATFSTNSNSLLYTCNCDKKNVAGFYDLKLCSARFEAGKWLPAEDIPFGSTHRSCHPTLSADGTMMVFSSKRPDGFGGMDLYVSVYMHGAWQYPQNLGSEINSSKDEVFPTISPDGYLIFSSNGLKGKGGLDLFYAKPTESYSWYSPQNMGPRFNSTQDDFGFLSFDNGTTGLLTSNRAGGKGQDDIYTWEIAIEESDELLTSNLFTNLHIVDQFTGIPLDQNKITLIEIDNNLLETNQLTDEINISSAVDPSILTILGKVLTAIPSKESKHQYMIQTNKDYFLMVEQKGYAPVQKIVGYEHLIKEDNYAIVMNPTQIEVLDQLVISDTEPVEDIIVSTNEIENPVIAGMVIIEDNSVQERTTQSLEKETSIEDEAVTAATSDQALDKATEVFTSRGIPADLIKGSERHSVNPAPKTEAVVTINNIYYEFNKYELTDQSKIEIDKIVSLMEKDEQMKITVKSHTDSRGKKGFNKWLSQQRADAVKNYITSKGIASFRIKAIGMGEGYLLNDCGDGVPCNEKQHKKNRRTEFIFNENKSIILN